MLRQTELKRVSVISFDFKQSPKASQARKTKFFRELYGYTQKVKQQLKDGDVVSRSYHYNGILDQLPHVKLGKSVFGVLPGTEDPVLKLLRAYEEVVFYNFIGWLAVDIWPAFEKENISTVNNLILRFGYLSLLLILERQREPIQKNMLIDYGFDSEYITQALEYLTQRELVTKTPNGFESTPRGNNIASKLTKITSL